MNIGIIGGMGPLATADLYRKIICMTKAASDQEHIHILIDSNTEIPDRSSAILRGGDTPLPELVRTALKLEAIGADILLMACNTAHYYYDQIQPFIHVPMLHMPEETALEAQRRGLTCVGLLATDGTCQTGIYDKAFAKYSIQLIKPLQEGQASIMRLIYDGVKAGSKKYFTNEVDIALDQMKKRGVQAFVLGCTELPLAFEMYNIEANTIDPTEVLARSAIRYVGKSIFEGNDA